MFNEKEKEVLSKYKHWKEYIIFLEEKNKDIKANSNKLDLLQKILIKTSPPFKGCGTCI